jgi:polar amino acid transport system substrate-binding protein
MLRRHALILAWLAAGLTGALDAAARPLQEVLNDGTLRIGVALYSPWTLRTPAGELIGFEIDVARKLASDMGAEPEFSVYPWEKIVPALEAGEVDIIAAGLSITPERALHVNFSQPYAEAGIALATNLETTALVSRLEDLNHADYAIAAVSGTVAEELADRVFPRAELTLFDDAQSASAALLEGRVDGYLEDEPVPSFLALENPTRVDVPLPEPLLQTRAGFAVNKGDPDFLAFLNAWITARESDTWLPTIHSYWFETLRWREQLEAPAR